MNSIHEYPVFRSLIFPTLLFGMPRKLALVLATATMAVALGLGQIWFVPLSVVIAVIFYFISKDDPYFFDIYLETIKLPEVYD
jgi:type IV secretory pathway TrbD component